MPLDELDHRSKEMRKDQRQRENDQRAADSVNYDEQQREDKQRPRGLYHALAEAEHG